MNSTEMKVLAKALAERAIRDLDLENPPEFGVVLGTGWNIVVENFLGRKRSIPIAMSPELDPGLGKIDGHARNYVTGILGGKSVIALNGRYHLNEAYFNEKLYSIVRLQIQILLEMGVRNFILTCAAGSLGGRANVGDIVVIDGFVSLYMPDLPSFGGEFFSAEDAITNNSIYDQAVRSSMFYEGGDILEGGYAMVRGPGFEGRKYDKQLLANSGASAVGMSMIPEATVLSLYKDEGAQGVGLAFITNDDKEEHSHEENQLRVKEKSIGLAGYLSDIIQSHS